MSDFKHAKSLRGFTLNETVIDSNLAADALLPVLTPYETSSSIIDWRCPKGATSSGDLKY